MTTAATAVRRNEATAMLYLEQAILVLREKWAIRKVEKAHIDPDDMLAIASTFVELADGTKLRIDVAVPNEDD